MAGSYSQSWEAASTATTNASGTVTVSGATANAKLIGIVEVRSGGDAFYTPTGWTLLKAYSDGADGFAWYERTASGTSADDFTPVWDDTGSYTAIVTEYLGLSTDTAEAVDGAWTSSAFTVTVISCGTVTPISAAGMAIAALGIRNSSYASDVDGGGVSIDLSFIKDWFHAPSVGNEAMVGIASLVYTSTSAIAPSWTGGNSKGYGSVAAFKEAATGGTSYTLDLTSGAFVIAGSSLTLTYTPSLTHYTLDLTAGAIDITGSSLTLSYEGSEATLDLTPGAIVVAGSSLNVTKQKNLSLTAGAIDVTGTSLSFAVGSSLSLTSGAIDITGSSLTLTYTPSGDKSISLVAGTITISGSLLTLTAPVRLVCRDTLTLSPLDQTGGLELTELTRESITLTRYC